MSGKVLHLILMTPLTGHEAADFYLRISHGQQPALAGQGAIEGNEEILLGAAQLDGDIKALVGLGKDQPIAAHRGAESMVPHLAGAQCLLIQPHIIKGGTIRRPDHIAGAIFDEIRQPDPLMQIQDGQTILAAGDPILRHQQITIIGADLEARQLEILSPGTTQIGIQQQLGRRLQTALVTLVKGKLVPRLIAGHIPVSLIVIRHRAVIGLLPRHHLGIELLLQLGSGRQDLVGITVLGLQIGQHLGSGTLVIAQPEIGIFAPIAVTLRNMRFASRNGRHRS